MSSPKAGTPAGALRELIACDHKRLKKLRKDALKLVYKAMTGRTQGEAAEHLGMPRRSFQDFLRWARENVDDFEEPDS